MNKYVVFFTNRTHEVVEAASMPEVISKYANRSIVLHIVRMYESIGDTEESVVRTFCEKCLGIVDPGL